MKNIIILLFLISIDCFSQIELEKPDNDINHNKTLTPVFAENINIDEYETAEQFLGLIGKELFFLPENSKYNFSTDKYESMYYLPKKKIKLDKIKYKANTMVNLSIADKKLIDYLNIQESYYIVDSIQFYDVSYPIKKIEGHKFNEIQKKKSRSHHLEGRVDLYTHHKTNNKIIIFNISSTDADKLIPVSHFNYLKNRYLDKKIILKKRGYIHNKQNNEISNFNRRFLDSSQIYKVTNIALKEPKSEYGKYYTPTFRLINNDKNIKEIEYYRIKDLILMNNFIKKAKKKEKYDSITKDSLKRQRIIVNKQRKVKKRKRIQRLVDKYGKNYGELVAKGEVKIGMSKQMCKDSWGKPNSINRTTNSYGRSEQWVYSNGNYLYFDNGKLTTIQN